MSKPIISGSSFVFDATQAYTFTFTYTGSTVYGYKLLITNRNTGATVYTTTVTTRQLQCTIPAGRLSNGNTYFVQVAAVDSQGNLSSYSNKVYATCHLKGTLTLNITDAQRITTSYVELTATFTQSSGTDSFKQCKFYLYEGNGTTLLSESVELYPSTNIQEYRFVGLENNTTYYLRCVGQTVAGFDLDTGLIRISILQGDFKTYNTFYVENKDGGIQYESNLIVIAPENSSSYSVDESMVDLSSKDMTYDSGYEIHDNFTLLWMGTHFTLQTTGDNEFQQGEAEILRFPENNAKLRLHFLQSGAPNDNEDNRQVFASFVIPQDTGDCLILSNVIEYDDTHEVGGDIVYNDAFHHFEHFLFKVWLKRYNNCWTIELAMECREPCEGGYKDL